MSLIDLISSIFKNIIDSYANNTYNRSNNGSKNRKANTYDVIHPSERLILAFKEIPLPPITPNPAPYLWAFYKETEPNNYEGHFRNGDLYNVKPRDKSISLYENRDIAYNARYIISDGIKYDLENPDSIMSMKIPTFNKKHGMQSPTSDLSYIMKMKANTENRPEIAVPMVYKAANLMMASPISWDKKDYYQIVKHLWIIGEIDYADNLLNELNERLPFMTDPEWIVNAQIEYEIALSKSIHDEITDFDRKSWEEWRKKTIEKDKENAQYFDRNHWINEYKNHYEYQKIVDIMGDKAPKSYSGYRRMKNNNTSNYQKILKIVEDNGITIN